MMKQRLSYKSLQKCLKGWKRMTRRAAMCVIIELLQFYNYNLMARCRTREW